MFKVITKADLVLLVILILFGLALFAASLLGNSRGQFAVVTVDGKEYGRYSLRQDQTVTLREKNHTNKFTIKNGVVQMTYSDCKNQVCVDTGAISETNQSIVCLPHKIVIEIQGGGDYDAVSN